MTDTKNREVDPRWHTAIHEAGHVVVARALRRDVTGITIEEGADSLGHARIAPWPKDFDPDLAHSNWRFRKRIEDQIMVLCAGRIAEERVNEDKVAVEDGSVGDYGKARELALLASSGNDDQACAWVEWLRLRTLPLVWDRLWWAVIQSLASALLVCPTMSARMVRAEILMGTDEFLAVRRGSSQGAR